MDSDKFAELKDRLQAARIQLQKSKKIIIKLEREIINNAIINDGKLQDAKMFYFICGAFGGMIVTIGSILIVYGLIR